MDKVPEVEVLGDGNSSSSRFLNLLSTETASRGAMNIHNLAIRYDVFYSHQQLQEFTTLYFWTLHATSFRCATRQQPSLVAPLRKIIPIVYGCPPSRLNRYSPFLKLFALFASFFSFASLNFLFMKLLAAADPRFAFLPFFSLFDVRRTLTLKI